MLVLNLISMKISPCKFTSYYFMGLLRFILPKYHISVIKILLNIVCNY